MKTKRLRLAAAALVMLLAVGCMAGPAPYSEAYSGPWPESSATQQAKPKRRLVAFDQMQYQRPDTDALLNEMAALTKTIKQAKSFEEVWQADEQAEAIGEEFNTAYALAQLHKYLDSSSDFYDEEFRYCAEGAVLLDGAVAELNRAILEGEYAGAYREKVGDYLYSAVQASTRLNDPAVDKLKQRRSELNADYNTRMAQYAPAAPAAKAGWLDSYNELSEIYLEMIELDKEIAETLGFESAAEMYYLEYSRDYTPQQAADFGVWTKQHLAPLYQSYQRAAGAGSEQLSESRLMKQMPGMLQRVSPQLRAAWEDMMEYGLYSFEANRHKQSGVAFTTTLDAYDAPFCYTYWDGTLHAGTTVIHEFGHFYDNWLHYGEPLVFNLDVAETYSQGLELLLQGQLGKLAKDAPGAQLAHLSESLGVLVYQIALEDFQQRVYALEEVSAPAVDQLYGEVLAEYLDYPAGASRDWVRITHLYDAPFYTVSYWTSMMAAMEIWAKARSNWEDGRDCYMAMITALQNQTFTALLAAGGLADPKREQAVQQVANELAAVLPEGQQAA